MDKQYKELKACSGKMEKLKCFKCFNFFDKKNNQKHLEDTVINTTDGISPKRYNPREVWDSGIYKRYGEKFRFFHCLI